MASDRGNLQNALELSPAGQAVSPLAFKFVAVPPLPGHLFFACSNKFPHIVGVLPKGHERSEKKGAFIMHVIQR